MEIQTLSFLRMTEHQTRTERTNRQAWMTTDMDRRSSQRAHGNGFQAMLCSVLETLRTQLNASRSAAPRGIDIPSSVT